MRRVTALLVILMLAALTVGPAAARVRRAKKSCCCEPVPVASLCARSCCTATPPGHAAELPVDLLAFAPHDAPLITIAPVPPPPRLANAAWAAALVSVRQRTAPRLPLRI